MKVVVVGAGIIGASVAYHLTRRGAEVEVVETARPGAGTSTASFAYLNAIRHPKPYGAFRLSGIAYWHRLAADLDAAALIHTDGALFCADNADDTARLEAHAADATDIGLETQWLSREAVMRDLEPDLTLPDTGQPVLRVPQEGWLETAPMIGRLLAAVRESGTTFRKATVQEIETAGPGVRLHTTAGMITADRAVLCTGPQTADALASAGVSLPVETRPGITIVTRPAALRLKHVVYARKVHFKPDGDGRVLAGRTDYRTEMPSPDETATHGRETLGLLRPLLRGFDDAEPECIRVGVRPIPGDGQPMVGPVPGLDAVYVAVSHSGISLGALIGTCAAEEIVDNTAPAALLPYRPDRFSGGTTRQTDFAPWAPGDASPEAPATAGAR